MGTASGFRSLDSEIELGGAPPGGSWAGGGAGGVLDIHAPNVGGSRLQRAWHRLRERRGPALLAVAVLLLLALVAAVSYSSGQHTGRLEVRSCAGLSLPAAGDTVAPEGSITADFVATHDYAGRPRSVRTAGGVVAADHGRCSETGAAVLREGGSAVDAAISAALCQGLHNPSASGVGGGHFMLIRMPNGTAEAIDAREVAPAAANETMYIGLPPDASINGGLAVAVPLELRGLWLAHQRHGRLPWARLLQPAIDVAERGFAAHPYLVASLSGGNTTAALLAWPGVRDAFFIREGGKWRPPRVNETCCRRPQLAALLRDVAADPGGPDVLYRGKYAAGLVADIQAAGGIITLADLAAAQPALRTPLRRRVWGLDWLAFPPPSSAATVLAALQILAGYEQPLAGAGALGMHRTAEAIKHAFALRMNLGDPGPEGSDSPFLNLTHILSALNSSEFIDSLRAATSDSGPLPLEQYGGAFNVTAAGLHPEDHGTSHLSVVDADRLAVSLTTTINTGFGSKVVSPSTGILLNNQMDDFSSPGQPNVYGLAPSIADFIRPGKRPASSMSPLIAARPDGALALVVGASGGPRIISAVLQAVIRLLGYGDDVLAAVSAPRMHHQLVPDTLYLEDWSTGGVDFKYDARLAQVQWHVECRARPRSRRGGTPSGGECGLPLQAIAVDPDSGELLGASDPRKDGAPAAAD